MPYATPSSLSSSPTSTITLTTTDRSMAPRPARHHMRSHSSDAIPTSSSGSHKQTSFIYVQPASPEGDKARSALIDATWSSAANAVAGPSNGVPPKPRRIKLFGFTPASAANEDGPSSQDESSSNEAARTDDEQVTPRVENANYTTNFTFATSGVPLVPVPSRTTSTPIVSAMRGSGRAKSDFTARTSAMVRKKSGELVRSSLKGGDPLRRDKPRSAPSTPIGAKYVHFDTQLEHVKHFIAQQRPAAVSRSGSPVETETEDEPEAFPFPAMTSAQAGSISLRLPNFPARFDHDQDAYVESLEMASDGKSIRGIVRVRNLSFEKWVAVRFTLDNWQTVSEVSAEHHESMGSMSDRFVFTIKLQDLLARLEAKTMFIAVRYNVGNREIWDNNGGQNYRVEFVKNPSAPTEPHGTATAHAPSGKRQGWTLGHGSHSADPMADLRRELDRLVMDDDLEPTAHHSTRSFTDGLPSMFSSRYDFGNSLKMFGTRPGTHFDGTHFDGFGHPPSASPPKINKAYSTTTIVGGMPATAYHEPASTVSTTYSHAPASASASSKPSAPLGSPIATRSDLPPDFGSSALQQYQAASPLYSKAASLYPGPPSGHRAPSPPPEAELARLYSGYQDRPFLPLQDTKMKTAVRTSCHKSPVPSPGAQIPSSMMHYTPLLPPTFRDRSRRSPLASPMNSPHDSPSISPQTMSPPRKASPPLYPDVSPPEEALWSPASSSTDPPSSVNSSDAQSVDSEATSIAGSPLQGTINRPSRPMELSSFLDRYCFHTGGLNGMPSDSSSDLATVPRRTLLSGCGYYSPAGSSRASSGASTPPREDATYATTFPSAIVS